MRTGQVMKNLGVTHQTLRDWERKGVLVPHRDDLNWRIYSPKQVKRIKEKLVQGNRNGKKLMKA